MTAPLAEGHVDPDRARYARFKALPREAPIHMLNLIRLRERALYPDGRESSGLETYRAYGRESGPAFRRLAAGRSGSGAPN